MAAHNWRQQWHRLLRQEAELAGLDVALPPDSARAPAGSSQQLRAQVDRQLAALDAMRGPSDAAAAPEVGRRRRTAAEALSQLAAACASQLAELEALEAQLGAEYQDAVENAHQLLAAALTAREEPVGGSARQLATAMATPGGSAADSSLPPEVTACDAFLQRHGPAGGWHPDDHAEFERILRACRGNYSHCAQLCGRELGLLHSADDIAQHARWHEELQRLALAKRLAVQQWRLARHAEQAAMLEASGQGGMAAVPEGSQHGSASSTQRAAEQQEQQRAAVAEWKAVRERERLEAAKQKEAEEREQREREVAARLRRQQENRQLLEARRQEKEAERAAKAAAAGAGLSAESSRDGSATSRSASSMAGSDPAARQRLRDRNAQLLGRRAAAVRRRSQQAAEHEERLQELARRASEQCGAGAAAERDPRRLLQATSATALRQLAALSEERAPRDSGFIRHLPRRATPGWMQ